MKNGRFTLLGIEEVDHLCEFCGRKEISKTFWVQDNETGETHGFGSVCIIKALKITRSELTREIDVRVQAIKAEYGPKLDAIFDRTMVLLDQWRADQGKTVGRPAQGEIPELETLNAEHDRLYREKMAALVKMGVVFPASVLAALNKETL